MTIKLSNEMWMDTCVKSIKQSINANRFFVSVKIKRKRGENKQWIGAMIGDRY